MEEISDHAKNLTLSEDLEKPLEERVNLFYNFVKVRIRSYLSIFTVHSFCFDVFTYPGLESDVVTVMTNLDRITAAFVLSFSWVIFRLCIISLKYA